VFRLRRSSRAALVVSLVWAAAGQTAARAQDQEVPPVAADKIAADEDAAELARLQRSAEVYRRARTAVVSVTVTTQGYNLPRLSIPGIQVPPRGAVVEELVCSGFVVHLDMPLRN
jgi:hypothetical protein